MIDGWIDKTPSELKTFEVDFGAEVPSGDSILNGGATGAVAVDSEGTSATSTLINSTTISGTKIIVSLKAAGTNGMDYRVTVTAEMDTANTIFQKIYEVRVRTDRRTF